MRVRVSRLEPSSSMTTRSIVQCAHLGLTCRASLDRHALHSKRRAGRVER